MGDAPTWRELLRAAGERVAGSDARRIAEQASGHEGADLHRHLDERPTTLAHTRWTDMVDRREKGEPLQYVLGCWGFRTLDLLVDRRVLIPRPETEAVVDIALAEIDRLASLSQGLLEPPALGAAPARPAEWRQVIADLGTGSGAIALSVVAERPGVEVWATDRSPDALDVVRANLAGLGRPAGRVRLAEGSWFGALPAELAGRLQLVVANPPYVAAGETLPEEVSAWEPRDALVAGPTGLEAIEAILAEAPRWLTTPGTLVLELAPHHAAAAAEAARSAGFSWVDVLPDLTGRLRALVARR